MKPNNGNGGRRNSSGEPAYMRNAGYSNSFFRFVPVLLIAAVVFSGLLATPTHAANKPTAPATVGLYIDSVSLKEGVTSHTHTLVVVYTDPNVKEGASDEILKRHQDMATVMPKVEVLGTLGELDAPKFSNYTSKLSAGARHFWSVDMTVEGLESGKDIEIPLWIIYGDAVNVAIFKIKTKKAQKQGNLDWTVTGPAKDLVLSGSTRTDFVLSTGPRPAVGIKIKNSTLQDPDTKERIGVEYLSLCEKKSNDKGQGLNHQQTNESCGDITVGAQSDKGVFLKIEGFKGKGTFAGNITLGLDNEKAPKSFELTVYASTGLAKVSGWGAIFLGLLIAFYSNVFARHYMARGQALLSVAHITNRLDGLRAQIVALEGKRENSQLEQLKRRIGQLSESLDRSKGPLSILLPSRFPPPHGGNTDWATKFKTHVESIAGDAAIVDVLVQEGLVVLDSRWQDLHDAAYRKATDAVDELADARDVADAETGLTKIFEDLQTDITPEAQLTERGMTAVEPVRSKINVEQLEFKVGLVSGSVWLIWLLVTLMAGAYVLIYSDPGFGVSADYFKCLFWGLGFGVAGNQLDSLTSVTTAQKFGIALPQAQ